MTTVPPTVAITDAAGLSVSRTGVDLLASGALWPAERPQGFAARIDASRTVRGIVAIIELTAYTQTPPAELLPGGCADYRNIGQTTMGRLAAERAATNGVATVAARKRRRDSDWSSRDMGPPGRRESDTSASRRKRVRWPWYGPCYPAVAP